MHHTLNLSPDPFLVLLFVSYTLLSYISFNLDTLAGEGRYEDNTICKKYFRMLYYALYLPYMISLVVPYSDFEKQMKERHIISRNWKKTFFLAARIAFWWLIIEIMLHYLYFESMLYDLEFAKRLPKDEFVSLGMALGMIFRL